MPTLEMQVLDVGYTAVANLWSFAFSRMNLLDISSAACAVLTLLCMDSNPNSNPIETLIQTLILPLHPFALKTAHKPMSTHSVG